MTTNGSHTPDYQRQDRAQNGCTHTQTDQSPSITRLAPQTPPPSTHPPTHSTCGHIYIRPGPEDQGLQFRFQTGPCSLRRFSDGSVPRSPGLSCSVLSVDPTPASAAPGLPCKTGPQEVHHTVERPESTMGDDFSEMNGAECRNRADQTTARPNPSKPMGCCRVRYGQGCGQRPLVGEVTQVLRSGEAGGRHQTCH